MNFENLFGTSKGKKDPLDNIFMLPSGSKTNKTIVNPNVIDMFQGQGHPRPDQKTKQQNAFLKRTTMGTGKSHLRFMDLDGDGVINGLDCKYKNPKKHGFTKTSDGGYKYDPDNFEQEQDLDKSQSFFKDDEVHKFLRNKRFMQ